MLTAAKQPATWGKTMQPNNINRRAVADLFFEMVCDLGRIAIRSYREGLSEKGWLIFFELAKVFLTLL